MKEMDTHNFYGEPFLPRSSSLRKRLLRQPMAFVMSMGRGRLHPGTVHVRYNTQDPFGHARIALERDTEKNLAAAF